MELTHHRHLAYCTNIHRGETWDETLAALEQYTLNVRRQVCPDDRFAIGLRLSCKAAMQLSDHTVLNTFRRWLDRHNCYVFTINGFPYGDFHGNRVKEQVFRPDWTSPDRLNYTIKLFDIISEIKPKDISGSVSTLPGSFKAFITSDDQITEICRNLGRCLDHVDRLNRQHRCDLHLGLEPEPLGLFESSTETVAFFDRLHAFFPRDERIERILGVNYDTCHLAVEFETAASAIAHLRDAHIRFSKIHLSSALKVAMNEAGRARLAAFNEDTYLHQVIIRDKNGTLQRYQDLDMALRDAPLSLCGRAGDEWRVHFHVPIHTAPQPPLESTTGHLLDVLDLLCEQPSFCEHLEMETYSWEVLPPELKQRSVVEQLVSEYGWLLNQLKRRGIGTT